MAGVVLHVQPDESLCNAEHDRNGNATLVPVLRIEELGGGELVLHEEEEGDVGEGTEEVAVGPILASGTNDLEHLRLDLALEGCVKLVSDAEAHA